MEKKRQPFAKPVYPATPKPEQPKWRPEQAKLTKQLEQPERKMEEKREREMEELREQLEWFENRNFGTAAIEEIRAKYPHDQANKDKETLLW